MRLVLAALPTQGGAQDDPALGARIADYNQRLGTLAAALSTPASPVAYVPPPAGNQPDYIAAHR